MGETTYIIIDNLEKRIYTGHNQDLNRVMSSLSKNPTSIEEFDQHQKETGSRLYDDGNRPKVPDKLPIETMRLVFGMEEGKFSPQEVEDHWKKTSFYEGPNYKSYKPNDRTKHDIPELTQEIIDEWKQEDPNAEEFLTANDYRRFLCNDGIVVADLRIKKLRYISYGAFKIPKNEYALPSEWEILIE
ncbi:hypothetical protein HOK68_00400 [Candidatus Woesearchaeota archaeon]|jgi:hypothetical protein|nr:hypothetical protein [Candidatus Woesearchaeota archaeon]MBT4595752.1 hypothetical protein [Candidatus Woesearchaeota archaeon]MBT5741399.1 hypothetical protein [Candidatus Woesearchaeota archaeon]MBT6505221.1 hypothetical protein [Candidatus Woesearchaeota archaeon]MBT7296095.1 hypothetical protein [Candidatus Woesearchaeota archaeon]